MDLNSVMRDTTARMDKSIDYFQRELRGIRTGRAIHARILTASTHAPLARRPRRANTPAPASSITAPGAGTVVRNRNEIQMSV